MLKNVKAWHVTFKVTSLNTYERYNYVYHSLHHKLSWCVVLPALFLFFFKII